MDSKQSKKQQVRFLPIYGNILVQNDHIWAVNKAKSTGSFTAHILAFLTKMLSYTGKKRTRFFLLCLLPMYEHFELKCYHIWAGNEYVVFCFVYCPYTSIFN